ncbi:MAG: hypothetical protein C0490_13490 [Marivirga sp.]|nr:hypothetical protein [Marivirga sp.]
MSTNKDMTIGISISEPEPDELGRLGLGLVHLQDAMVETARFLLSKGYNLAYGGDLTYEGPYNFTKLLFEMGLTYPATDTDLTRDYRIKNYSAFPLYTKITRKREAELINVAQIIKVNPSPDFDKWLNVRYDEATENEKKFLDRVFDVTDNESRQIWASSLTAMRKEMTKNIHGRIVMGGKTIKFLGAAPGIIEETLLCIENNVTVFIDGNFGGAAWMFIRDYANLITDKGGIEIGNNQFVIAGQHQFNDIINFFR